MLAYIGSKVEVSGAAPAPKAGEMSCVNADVPAAEAANCPSWGASGMVAPTMALEIRPGAIPATAEPRTPLPTPNRTHFCV